jgi:8-oxo-dGTP diphosphatase
LTEKKLREKLSELYDHGTGDGHAAYGGMTPPTLWHGTDSTTTTIADEIVAAFHRPRVGVAVCVFDWIDGEAHVLMELRRGAHGAGTWSIPGGWVEYGETFERAALRELYEETGVQAEEARFVTAVTTVFEDEKLHCVTAYVAVKRWWVDPEDAALLGSDPRQPVNKIPDKCAELRFHPVESLPAPLFPSIVTVIADRQKFGELFTYPEVRNGRRK